MAQDPDRRESERIISRVGAETEAHMASHAPEEDASELWGRRIGRALSFVLLAVILWWLYEALLAVGPS